VVLLDSPLHCCRLGSGSLGVSGLDHAFRQIKLGRWLAHLCVFLQRRDDDAIPALVVQMTVAGKRKPLYYARDDRFWWSGLHFGCAAIPTTCLGQGKFNLNFNGADRSVRPTQSSAEGEAVGLAQQVPGFAVVGVDVGCGAVPWGET